MKTMRLWMALMALSMLTACHEVSVPTEYTQSDALPAIYPDYVNVTIPVNIAPLTFEADQPTDEMVACYTAGGQEIVCSGQMQPGIDEWREMTAMAKGAAIKVDVYMRNEGQWTRYKPFNLYVSPDSIDPYISYRLIHPSFVTYESLTINQRCLENYDESVIYDNFLCGYEKDGQCINCHHFQNYNPERMQFHARQYRGGTLIAYDGKMKKVNMKNDSILSAGVYPAWHPSLNLIVYATDKTFQYFHTVHSNKVEVYDLSSDIIAYDVDNDLVTNLENDPKEYEVFPCWAPDGKTLYYCSGHFIDADSAASTHKEMAARYNRLKYNIYQKKFNPQTMSFGPRELVFDAIADGQSAVLPRISPDGRFMLFSSAEYGYFHIWHHDADLWLMDLRSGEVRKMNEWNSPDTESYHSWSSNGRWVIFSSRRDDGSFTRPFIAHFDADGHGSKPFELPTADADYHRQFMRSYNIPEFMRGPVSIRPQDFAEVLKGEGVDVEYRQRLKKPHWMEK